MRNICSQIVVGLALSALLFAGPGPAQEAKQKQVPAARVDRNGDPLPESALFRLGTTRFRLGGYVSGLAISSDGTMLALNNNQGGITLLDAATGKEIRKISGDPGGVQALTFTPDGKKLVSWGFQGFHAVDVASGVSQGRFPFQNRTGRFGPLAFSADGKTLVVGSSNFGQQNQKSHLFALELNTGKEVGKFEVVQNFQVNGTISGNGKILASWGQSLSRGGGADHQRMQEDSRTVQVWDLASGKELRRLKSTVGYGIMSAALTADGQTMAVASGGGSTLTLWNTKTGKEIRRWACRRAQQAMLTFSPDGKILALADATDGMLQLWDTTTHKRLGLFEGKHCRFSGMAFLPKGTIRLCGIDGQAIVVWEVLPEKMLTPVGGHLHQISSLTFSQSGKELISAGADGTICHWDLKTGKELRQTRFLDEDARRFGGPFYPQGGIVFSPDGRFCASYSQFNNNLRLRELPSGKAVCDLEGTFGVPGGPGVTFSPNGKLVAAGGRDQFVRVWNIASGEELSLIKGNANQSLSLAFSPDGKSLAMRAFGFNPGGGQAGELLLAEVAGGKILWKEESQGFNNASLLFTGDGKWLLTVDPMKMSLRDPASGKESRHFQTNSANINGVALSADNRLLALSHVNYQFRGNFQEATSAISVWELASGQMRCQFKGHQGMITQLAFSRDGKVLASGGADTTILLWNVRSGRAEPRAQAWSPKEIQEVWESLADNAGKAHGVIYKMLSAPTEAIGLLQKNLTIPKPVKVDPQQIQQWIGDLGSEQFVTRESATKKLEQAGLLAAEALNQARKGKQPLEVIRRLDHLLKKLQSAAPSAKDLRRLRALEVLEMLASPQARELLQQQAKGLPGDPVTLDAQAVLRRLQKKGNGPE
jgi:WD40 repeat protein